MKYLFLVLAILIIGCSSTLEKASPVVGERPPVSELSQPEKNLIESEKWLNEKSRETGVSRTKSGLLYKKITNTSNCRPHPDSLVTLHYSSRVPKEVNAFDSSFQRGAPGTFPINRMIPAWVEGLPLMREGETWEFYVHPNLAYGERGSGDKIQPNTALVFVVQIIKVHDCK